MGYTTKFKGVLKFAHTPTVEVLKALKSYFGGDMRELDAAYAEKHGVTYIDLRLTDDFSGVEWDDETEKNQGMVEAINWLVGKVKAAADPEFELMGELKATGEDSDDRWILRMVNGWATRIDVEPKGLLVKCPDCGCEFRVDPKTGAKASDD